ncbi:hypothetical protein JB92DRAFT_2836884 [Gautieria morchelliformis]|nr:hypothetical protein JB92DRAFT_2836884 [Gautieria morchelliformis]
MKKAEPFHRESTRRPMKQRNDAPYTALPYAVLQLITHIPQEEMLQYMCDLSITPRSDHAASSFAIPRRLRCVRTLHLTTHVCTFVDSHTDFASHRHGQLWQWESGTGSPPPGICTSGLVYGTAHHEYHHTGPALCSHLRRSSAHDDDGRSDDREHDAGGSGVGRSPQSTAGMSGHILLKTLAHGAPHSHLR